MVERQPDEGFVRRCSRCPAARRDWVDACGGLVHILLDRSRRVLSNVRQFLSALAEPLSANPDFSSKSAH